MVQKTCKAALTVLLSLIISGAFGLRVAASDLTISDLVDESLVYDGQTVTISAEVIGEVLERGDDAWINVNDGTSAIGIWLTLDDAETIRYFGDYDAIGDTVLITGIFHRSCPLHGGDVDIHAETFVITEPGQDVAHPLSIPKLIWAGVLTLAATAANIVWRGGRRRNKPVDAHLAITDD